MLTKRIIKALREGGAMPVADLAHSLDLSATAVWNRVQILADAGFVGLVPGGDTVAPAPALFPEFDPVRPTPRDLRDLARRYRTKDRRQALVHLVAAERPAVRNI